MLLVTTAGFHSRGLVDEVRRLSTGKEITVLDWVTPNPALKDLEDNFHQLREQQLDYVVALGGGSVIDTAKAYSLLPSLKDAYAIRRHLEEKESLLLDKRIPLVAIPTTSGTGSEVTPFATLWDMERRKKYSLTSPYLFPEQAILDPYLTLDLPGDITLSSGLDALSHALESVWNHNANPLTRLYSFQATRLLLQNLHLVCYTPDLTSRTRMMEASLFAGLAISGTRTALAHSISYPITAHFGLPHGLACSFTLPQVMKYNQEADTGELLDLANFLGFSTLDALVQEIERVFTLLGLSDELKKYLPSLEAIISLSSQMITPGRMENNIREAGVQDIEKILLGLRKDGFLE